ncbi:sugar ABC transporter permease [Paenibacillus sp. J5C_2022]|uniref:ABC transporter permease n=1 Tax=Paenibacillus sp. J5C2022 TaxID=2977129 RepID=UPI0021D3BA94|nr:sugar ABC transporter permease [Paenibacillus sp. J5C2022]MCU6712747.1 sugar ABC transporter permease [Paenibacillus sp. J5C2022]
MNTQVSLKPNPKYKPSPVKSIIKNRWLYFMLLPGVLFFIVFKYIPMYGIIIAFQNYQPFLGIGGSEWVGLYHFERLFTEPSFFQLFRNTLILAVYQLVFFFPLPIVMALMLNEIRIAAYKRIMQTMIYVPHFISWVVIIGIVYVLFGTQNGVINGIIGELGGEKINFLLSTDWLRPLLVMQWIWKEAGWGTIIYLAALAGVDQQQYESAVIDGANRFRQMWHITLPSIRSTIVILLILHMGSFLDNGFEQIFLMLNDLNREVGEVFDTYVYTSGIAKGAYSYGTAVGLFKSVVGLILVGISNHLAKKFGEEGIF